MPDRGARRHEYTGRLAGSDHGDVVVRVDDRDLVVATVDGRHTRSVRFDDIAELTSSGDLVRVALLSRESLELRCAQAPELDAELADACRVLPELTHALRSLGSSRTGAHSARQHEFFGPLLDARRRAEEAVGRRDAVNAFSVERITRAIGAQNATLAESYADPRPAARRAFAAQIEDATEPLRRALAALGDASAAAESPSADARIASWRAWQRALAGVFVAADHCWTELERTIRQDPVNRRKRTGRGSRPSG